MLIEIHVLQNHAPSNLNRDDTGSPKECVFGGYKRARISSQCLKRSIRRSDTFQEALQGHLATRTRQLPELIRARFIQAGLNDRQLAFGRAEEVVGVLGGEALHQRLGIGEADVLDGGAGQAAEQE